MDFRAKLIIPQQIVPNDHPQFVEAVHPRDQEKSIMLVPLLKVKEMRLQYPQPNPVEMIMILTGVKIKMTTNQGGPEGFVNPCVQ